MFLKPEPLEFSTRDQLIEQVKKISNWFDDYFVSEIRGGDLEARERLLKIDPINYSKSRNYLNGKVTKLSPFIRHGILSLNEVRNFALGKASQPHQIEKFIQELAWRDFWQRIYFADPAKIWRDIEDYKTGYSANDYAGELPQDVIKAVTPNAAINYFIKELTSSGYLHNHARMYLASYLIHWRRVKWQVGAKWFLHHLLDGDPASNNLSWQWVASTFSNKPYIFNLENIAKYADENVDVSPKNNPELNFSYEDLALKLWPMLSKLSNQPRLNQVAEFSKKEAEPKSNSENRSSEEADLIWLHEDFLSKNHPVFKSALRFGSATRAIFVWDQAYFKEMNYSFKRLVFIYESLVAMKAEIYVGDSFEVVKDLVVKNGFKQIASGRTPNPELNKIAQKISQIAPINFVSEANFVLLKSEPNLRRFFNYWNKAAKSALSKDGVC